MFELTSGRSKQERYLFSRTPWLQFSLTLKTYFSNILDDGIELFLFGERFSQIFFDSCSQTVSSTRMCLERNQFVGWHYVLLKVSNPPFKPLAIHLSKVYARTNMDRVTKVHIISSEPSNSNGRHWLLLIVINNRDENWTSVCVCSRWPILFYYHFLIRQIRFFCGAPCAFKALKLPSSKFESMEPILFVFGSLLGEIPIHWIAQRNKVLRTTEFDILRCFNRTNEGAIFKDNDSSNRKYN